MKKKIFNVMTSVCTLALALSPFFSIKDPVLFFLVNQHILRKKILKTNKKNLIQKSNVGGVNICLPTFQNIYLS